jgi:adenine-specific DNA-methyltransferase
MMHLQPLAPSNTLFKDKQALIRACIGLGAANFGGPLSVQEQAIIADVHSDVDGAAAARSAILHGGDPLGASLAALMEIEEKRDKGAFYTPKEVVRSMVDWALSYDPYRVVDPGCGSGRFAAEVARRRPSIEIFAIDLDPLATLVCRAVLCTLDARNAHVINADYTAIRLPAIWGRTAFVGNPPYVRHHRLSHEHKVRLKAEASKIGLELSGLAGLQVHFFMATFGLAKTGDIASFITSSEWLDVHYGDALRKALSDGYSASAFELFDEEESTFDDAMTTALITCLEVGRCSESVPVNSTLAGLPRSKIPEPRSVQMSTLRNTRRWRSVLRGTTDLNKAENGLVKLGDIVRVSRGIATGANSYFVLNRNQAKLLGLEQYGHPVLHASQQVLENPGEIRASATDMVVLDPPKDISPESPQHAALRSYLEMGVRRGINMRYLAAHRNPWWHLSAKAPPIVATYMARQAPAFALNPDKLRILNVVHGLYPRQHLEMDQMAGLVNYLNRNRNGFRGMGRTYQGGLEKFEPSEMEQFLVPPPDRLADFA